MFELFVYVKSLIYRVRINSFIDAVYAIWIVFKYYLIPPVKSVIARNASSKGLTPTLSISTGFGGGKTNMMSPKSDNPRSPFPNTAGSNKSSMMSSSPSPANAPRSPVAVRPPVKTGPPSKTSTFRPPPLPRPHPNTGYEGWHIEYFVSSF